MGDLANEYVTTKQAADALGVSKARVDQFCRDGRLKSEMVGTVRLIRKTDLAAFKKVARAPGKPKGKKKPGSE